MEVREEGKLALKKRKKRRKKVVVMTTTRCARIAFRSEPNHLRAAALLGGVAGRAPCAPAANMRFFSAGFRICKKGQGAVGEGVEISTSRKRETHRPLPTTGMEQ